MKTKLVVGVVGVVLLWLLFIPFISKEQVTFQPTKVERISDGADSYYLVYSNQETFKNVDSWAYMKFNSRDFVGKFESAIRNNRILTCNVNMYGIPFISTHRNIGTCNF